MESDSNHNNDSANEEKSNTIRQEFKELGQNIRDVFGNAWESKEKQKLQDDLKNGLNDLGDALGKLTSDLRVKDFTQKMVDGVEGLGERVRNGEIENKTKGDILNALEKINQSLTKASSKFTTQGESVSEETQEEPETASE